MSLSTHLLVAAFIIFISVVSMTTYWYSTSASLTASSEPTQLEMQINTLDQIASNSSAFQRLVHRVKQLELEYAQLRNSTIKSVLGLTLGLGVNPIESPNTTEHATSTANRDAQTPAPTLIQSLQKRASAARMTNQYNQRQHTSPQLFNSKGVSPAILPAALLARVCNASNLEFVSEGIGIRCTVINYLGL